MRLPRIKNPAELQKNYQHLWFRVVDKQFLFTNPVKSTIHTIMKETAFFCGVQMLTFHLMDNHCHFVVDVVPLPKDPLSNQEILKRLSKVTTQQAKIDEEQLRKALDQGNTKIINKLRNKQIRRMGSVDEFMKMFLERVAQWYNKENDRKGPLNEAPFSNQLLESGKALSTSAAYADLNSFRAYKVNDPKDYEWGGYGQACRGDAEALAGLRVIVSDLLRIPPNRLTDEQVLVYYRLLLFMEGRQKSLEAPSTPPPRRCFAPEFVEKEFAQAVKARRRLQARFNLQVIPRGKAMGSIAFLACVHKSNPWFKGDFQDQKIKIFRDSDGEALCLYRDFSKDPLLDAKPPKKKQDPVPVDSGP